MSTFISSTNMGGKKQISTGGPREGQKIGNTMGFGGAEQILAHGNPVPGQPIGNTMGFGGMEQKIYHNPALVYG